MRMANNQDPFKCKSHICAGDGETSSAPDALRSSAHPETSAFLGKRLDAWPGNKVQAFSGLL